MKRDVDALLREQELDGLVVLGPGGHNPSLVYLLGQPAHLTDAWVVKKPDQMPVLYHWPMERDEAARVGVPTRDLTPFSRRRFLDAAQGDPFRAQVLQTLALLDDAGLGRGRIAVTGRVELGPHLSLWQAVQAERPGLRVEGRLAQQILRTARTTKDADEVARIRRMGALTVEVVGRVMDRLRGLRAGSDGLVVDAAGEVVTIGQVKAWVRRWVAELNAELPLAVIFAQGYDAGVPHSTGDDMAALRVGVPIVFDLFPQEAGGGYFYDFTRTWSLGYASERVQALHAQVEEAYRAALKVLRAGHAAETPYLAACEVLEGYGHPTPRTRPGTQEGFVHSLGHGLGLDIHEMPRLAAGQRDPLLPGMVVTVEPGLYYPRDEIGIRIEDTVWIDGAGQPQVLADFPHDLVLPLRG
ncbi:MAG: aminopeptidase P family protein [Chloroflexi bacterium]|nr:aminopeptidase P family protein [Chloroflexota bacterium]